MKFVSFHNIYVKYCVMSVLVHLVKRNSRTVVMGYLKVISRNTPVHLQTLQPGSYSLPLFQQVLLYTYKMIGYMLNALSKILRNYGDIIFACVGLTHLLIDRCTALTTFESLSGRTCCGTGPRFLRSPPKDRLNLVAM